MACVRVLLVDDHDLVRAGIRSLLRDVSEIEVVGEADRGVEAVALVGALRPDVVVMDVSMPGSGGIAALEVITREHPATRVVILSMHDNPEIVRSALRAGAAGYLVKDASLRELEFAILSVAGGGRYLAPAVARDVVDSFVHQGESRGRAAERLTDRQREIVGHIAAGRSNREIAHVLGVSTKTVESHRATLMERLGIHDVAGIVRYAIRAGLVDPAE